MKRRRVLAACVAIGVTGCSNRAPGDTSSTPFNTSDASTDTSDGSGSRQSGPTVAGAWPLADCDPANTGYNPNANGIGQDGGRRWRSPINANILSAPAVSGDIALTGGDTSVFAYDVADGRKQWVADVGVKTAAFTPIVADGTVYQCAGSEDGGLFALAKDGGKELWSKTVTAPTQPIATDNALYVGETTKPEARIRSLTLSGESNWTFEMPGGRTPVSAAPAADDTGVYALANYGGSSGGESTPRLYALAAGDGSKQWEADLTGGSDAAPAVGDERVYVPGTDGTVYAIGKSSGETEWTFPTGTSIRSSPALADGTLFVGNLNGDFYAIDATSGQKRWNADTNISNTSPAVATDTVYVGGGPVYGFDIEDGSTRWSYREDAFSTSFYSPAVVGDALYIGICLKDHPSDYYDNYLYQFSS